MVMSKHLQEVAEAIADNIIEINSSLEKESEKANEEDDNKIEKIKEKLRSKPLLDRIFKSKEVAKLEEEIKEIRNNKLTEESLYLIKKHSDLSFSLKDGSPEEINIFYPKVINQKLNNFAKKFNNKIGKETNNEKYLLSLRLDMEYKNRKDLIFLINERLKHEKRVADERIAEYLKNMDYYIEKTLHASTHFSTLKDYLSDYGREDNRPYLIKTIEFKNKSIKEYIDENPMIPNELRADYRHQVNEKIAAFETKIKQTFSIDKYINEFKECHSLFDDGICPKIDLSEKISFLIEDVDQYICYLQKKGGIEEKNIVSELTEIKERFMSNLLSHYKENAQNIISKRQESLIDQIDENFHVVEKEMQKCKDIAHSCIEELKKSELSGHEKYQLNKIIEEMQDRYSSLDSTQKDFSLIKEYIKETEQTLKKIEETTDMKTLRTLLENIEDKYKRYIEIYHKINDTITPFREVQNFTEECENRMSM